MIRPTAIALLIALAIPQFTPQKANAQAVIGVPVVETVIIGGIALYVWYINGQRHESQTYPVLPDPEEEIDRMGNNATQGKVVKARTASEAQSRCESYAGDRATDTPEYLGNNSWRCRYH